MAFSGVFPLALGLLVGAMVAFLFTQYETIIGKTMKSPLRAPIWDGLSLQYSVGGKSFYLRRESQNELGEAVVIDNELTRLVTQFPFDPLHNSSLLEEKVRVLCYVVVGKATDQAIQAAKAVMGNRCTKTVIFTKDTKADVGSIGLGFPTSSDDSWLRYLVSTEYVYGQYRENYDLFIKLEYDIFVVPENVRFMSLLHQAYIPGYLGHVIMDNRPRGAVVVLTQEGLDLFHEAVQSCAVQASGTHEEVGIEKCLRPLSVLATQESKGLDNVSRLQMVIPDHKLPGNTIAFTSWYMRFIHHPYQTGPDCCSDYSVSFHYVAPNMMYQLEYMVYHLRPFGVGYYMCPADIRSIIGLPADVPQALQDQSNPEKKQAAAEQPKEAEPDPGKQEPPKQEENAEKVVAGAPEAAKKEPSADAEQKDDGGDKQKEKPKQ